MALKMAKFWRLILGALISGKTFIKPPKLYDLAGYKEQLLSDNLKI